MDACGPNLVYESGLLFSKIANDRQLETFVVVGLKHQDQPDRQSSKSEQHADQTIRYQGITNAIMVSTIQSTIHAAWKKID